MTFKLHLVHLAAHFEVVEPDLDEAQTIADIRAFAETRPLFKSLVDSSTASFEQNRRESRRSACLNNLRLIQHAKRQLFQAAGNMPESHVPAQAEIRPYSWSSVFVCPEGGTYAINAITSPPTCTLNAAPYNHVLDPKDVR